jgi:predicted DNA-binding transcriptional regulator AlpA
MEVTPRILLIGEVANLLRVSIPTINRWIHQTRRGQGQFPLPISTNRGKGRWLSTDIESFLQSQSNTVLPVNTVSATQRKREAKSFKQRQDAAKVALARHRNPTDAMVQKGIFANH